MAPYSLITEMFNNTVSSLTLMSDNIYLNNTTTDIISLDEIIDSMTTILTKAKISHQLLSSSVNASRATLRGIEYAHASISMLTKEELNTHYNDIKHALATFEIWRHSLNMIDDIADEEYETSNYREFFNLTKSEFVTAGSNLLSISQQEFAKITFDKNESPDHLKLISKFFCGYQLVNGAREKRKIIDYEENPLNSYWTKHAGIVTGTFFQIAYSIIDNLSLIPDSENLISKIGYQFGKLLHSNNDLNGLYADILNGDFSWPVIYLAKEQNPKIYPILQSEEETEKNIEQIKSDLISINGGIAKFQNEISSLYKEINKNLEILQERGRGCENMIAITEYTMNRIKNSVKILQTEAI